MTIDLPEGINRLTGEAEGQTLFLLKKVHGDELGGGKVVDMVTESISSITKGILYTGIGNPLAAESNIRFVDSDLNRSFGKTISENYEFRRANVLKPIFEKTNILIDVHSFQKPSPPIVCYPGNDFEQLKRITAYLPIETIVYGPGLWPPNGDSIYTDTYVCSNDGFAITVESGYLDDMRFVEGIAAGIQKIIQELLGAQLNNVLTTKLNISKKYFYAYENIVATIGFAFNKEWMPFEFIPKGAIFAECKNKRYVADRDSYILFPQANENILEGDEVCILLEKK